MRVTVIGQVVTTNRAGEKSCEDALFHTGDVVGLLVELDQHGGLHLDCGDYGRDSAGAWVFYAPEPKEAVPVYDGNGTFDRLLGRATLTYLAAADVKTGPKGAISVAERVWANGWRGSLVKGEWVPA